MISCPCMGASNVGVVSAHTLLAGRIRYQTMCKSNTSAIKIIDLRMEKQTTFNQSATLSQSTPYYRRVFYAGFIVNVPGTRLKNKMQKLVQSVNRSNT